MEGDTQRRRKLHRHALNDLWVLRTSQGLSGPPLEWVQVSTVGRAPVARGFHVAAAGGSNLFVWGGCDEIDSRCDTAAYMLDTTYQHGMRWHRLPTSVDRPRPRHQMVGWASGTKLFVQGGCELSASQSGACFSDMWSLELGGLMEGEKRLMNASRPFDAERCPSCGGGGGGG